MDEVSFCFTREELVGQVPVADGTILFTPRAIYLDMDGKRLGPYGSAAEKAAETA